MFGCVVITVHFIFSYLIIRDSFFLLNKTSCTNLKYFLFAFFSFFLFFGGVLTMLQMYDIPTWTEENRTLLDTLSQAKVSPEISNSLQQQLYMNKHKFLGLLENQPKNSSHRADLNASKC